MAALDRLTGGLLLAASAAGVGFAVSLFEAKHELARLSDELVRELGQRIRGLDRYSRSDLASGGQAASCWAACWVRQAGLVTACRTWLMADRTRKASVISMMP